MSEPAASEQPDRPGRGRFPWRAYFHRTAGPVFVVGASRRLRYANPAWERLTGRPLAKVRGMRVSARRSASPLGQALAAPPEAWAGRPAQVRRAVPPADTGPPWWDITFVPLPGDGRPLGVLGFVTAVGERVPKVERVAADLAEVRRGHAAAFGFELFAGTERLLAQVRLAAQTSVPVWVVGEAGSGKETLARVIHHNGPTRERAFLGLDCTGVQPAFVESLLFGKGGVAGHLGTLYLKEPAALPRDAQDRLAALVTPPRENGPRLICGAVRPALDDVSAGRLIPPFHSALSVLELRVPPLRDRLDELPKLADALLARAGLDRLIADDVWPELRGHPWPGNVRELASVLCSAATKATDDVIEPRHLPRYVREGKLCAAVTPPKAWTLDGVLEAVEKRLIELALRKTGNQQTEAAEVLGVFRTRLWRRLEALGIPVPPQPPKPRKKKDEE